MIQALQQQGIENTYINLIKEIYSEAKATIRPDDETETKPVIIYREVRQGDTIYHQSYNCIRKHLQKS